ncbi:MAG TPA: hypothetical protein VG370_17520 [Chloroflexota bacterium]|jgi:hypothetical protein|nr:hypothetical protein [Chloroflexota bacterium]
MRRTLRFPVILTMLVASSVLAPAAQAQTTPSPAVPGACQQGTLPHGALWLVCVPAAGWNGDLVIWAHGYVAPNQPLGFYHLASDGTNLPDAVQGLGYAFATTSYRQNGLAVLEGADDVRELVALFPDVAGRAPARTYQTGASEGGLVTTLLVERSPGLFSGGLAACGPIGSFKRQTDYFGDFRVLFDYFFPGVLPGSPVAVPPELMERWESTYVPRITAALAANREAAWQLIRTSKAATDPAHPWESVVETTLNLLWYHAFGTNDAVAKLGGNPYGNRGRWYRGSDDDLRLNRTVPRFGADPAALSNLVAYETSGQLGRPLVTLHTIGDEIVPFWHELLYAAKAWPAGRGSLTPVPAFRYGHCRFNVVEVLAAFGLLVERVTGSQPAGLAQRLDVEQVRRDLAGAQREADR